MNLKPTQIVPLTPRLAGVLALPEGRLLLGFANGEVRLFDAVYLFDTEAFGRLRDPGYFVRARTPGGRHVEWPDGPDLSRDTLYVRSRAVDPGRWVREALHLEDADAA